MARVLYIKATPKEVNDSWTLKMSEYFIEQYKQSHPDDTVTELDLYRENIEFLSASDLTLMMQEDKGEFAHYVDQFLAHDKYVVAAPFWNYSVPAILRAYIDRVITIGKTFSYTDEGIKSLIPGRPAMFFMARGGFYSQPPMSEFEHGARYWDSIATSFFGFKSKQHIMDGTGILPLHEVEQLLADKKQAIKNDAISF